MNTKEIKLDNGTILKPVEPLLSDEQMQKFSEMMNSPEYKNYAASQMQEQLYENFGLNKPVQPPKNQMVEEQKQTNELIEFTNEQILELQNQLKDSKVQLKQANDKITSQTLVIEQLKTDLKEESEKANKMSSKDWIGHLISGIIGLIVGIASTVIANVIIS